MQPIFRERAYREVLVEAFCGTCGANLTIWSTRALAGSAAVEYGHECWKCQEWHPWASEGTPQHYPATRRIYADAEEESPR